MLAGIMLPMQKAKSHYDNLKVSRDAPLEVIRAAYRTLAQRYHPDRNSNSPDAERIMGLINKAYEVLSNPAKRCEHDAWLQSVERNGSPQENWGFTYDVSGDANAKVKPRTEQEPRERAPEATRQEPVSRTIPSILGFKLAQHVRANWFFYAFVSVLAIFVISKISTPTTFSSKSYLEEGRSSTSGASTEVKTPPRNVQRYAPGTAGGVGNLSGLQSGVAARQSRRYVRPENAPNGYPWPGQSNYVKGYRILNNDGRSSVTIDNTRNTSDVFVKLATLDVPEHPPVRQFLILAGQSFSLEKVRAGGYEIRYRDLDTGAMARSEPIQLEETVVGRTINFSNVSITLYKVRDGNMNTYSIDEDSF